MGNGRRHDRAERGASAPGDEPRIAVVSLHTSPLDQPGSGDSGGMNVFIRAAAERLSAGGVQVDVFTRTRDERRPEVEELGNGSRLINVQAGPSAPGAEGRAPAVPAGVPRRRPAAGTRGGVGLRPRPHALLALGLGGAQRPRDLGRPARGLVPHPRQGEELLPVARRASRAPGPSVGRGAGDRGRGPAGRGDARSRRRSSSACTGPSPIASASSPPASTTACSSRAIGAGPRRGSTSRTCGCCCSSAGCRRTRVPTSPSERSPRRSPATRAGRATSCSRSSAGRAARTTAPRWPG